MVGPTYILQCPHSAAVVGRGSYLTANMSYATTWSDGEVTFVPRLPEITRCGDAGRFFWVDDAKVLDRALFGLAAKS